MARSEPKALLAWREALEAFRAAERQDAAFIMADEPAVVKLCVAWRAVQLDVLPQGAPPAREVARWAWLWDAVEIDKDALAAATGLMRHELDRALRMAVANRLIYPDGGVSQGAEAVVQFKFRQAIGRTGKQ